VRSGERAGRRVRAIGKLTRKKLEPAIFMSRLGLRGVALASLVLCLQLFSARAGAVPFLISVDTSPLQGLSGFLDLQFNPADVGTPGALANISAFAGNLGLVGTPIVDGDVSGMLPGAVQLGNTGVFNAYFQAVQFGSLVRFVVDFTGDFLTQPSLLGTSFSVGLLNDGFMPLLTNDASGSLLRFELQAGNVTFQAFQANGRVAATVTPVPLPATSALFAAGLLLLFGQALLRRSSSR